MAKRDAAFEAYKALYRAGLVDDHLLPLGHIDEGVDQAYSTVEKRPNLVEVASQMNPWKKVAQEWHVSETIQASTIAIIEGGVVQSRMMVLLPCAVPSVAEFQLYWKGNTILKAIIEPNLRLLDRSILASAKETTVLLMKSVFQGRMDARDDFIALFIPCGIVNLRAWVQDASGSISANDISERDVGENIGLIRDLSHNRAPYVFRNVTYAAAGDLLFSDSMEIDADDTKHEGTLLCVPADHGIDANESTVAGGNVSNSDQPMTEVSLEYAQTEAIPSEKIAFDMVTNSEHRDNIGGRVLLEVIKLPKKIDFLHHSNSQDSKAAQGEKVRTISAYHCEMDRLPFRYSQFALFIPSILHRVQVALVVDHLCEGILSPLEIKDRTLVTSAISASSANEDMDYQRLEFFGDSMLKYMTSLSLFAGHLHWHEGILSHKKDHIVANSSLALAALETGLDQYILSKAFTGRKWRPVYRSEFLQPRAERKREMSSKILADVVEALIGAAYLDGGTPKVLACLEIFLPKISWIAPTEACQLLRAVYNIEICQSTHLVQVEHLISYSFNCKALLVEALTHGSHRGPNSSSSYQRLEFLGDAILDNIVTRAAFSHDPPIPTPQLHLIRTALVNGNYLGFLCLNLSIVQARRDLVTRDPQNISTAEVAHHFHLWQAMRHASPSVTIAQRECVLRYQTTHASISSLLVLGHYYPWSALSRLEPPKPMSDIVESLLGAIYIDTRGSLLACEAFLQRLGLMVYLRRVLDGGVALLHPKEELGRLANQDQVRYEMGEEGEEGQQYFTCSIQIGGKEVINMGQGLSVMEVQTRAADEACKLMKKETAANMSSFVENEENFEAQEGIESGSGGEGVTKGKGCYESDSDAYVTAVE